MGHELDLSIISWHRYGEREYGVLAGTGAPFVRLAQRDGLFEVRFNHARPRQGHGARAQSPWKLKVMVTAWATAHSDALKLKIPAKFDPNAPATEYERYFYDAIWPGYVPASRLKRYG